MSSGSGFKGIMKDGWHPKGKDGGKESWRGDFKGINQVAGWMGKGKDPTKAQEDHVSRPLATLKDPASFGPPPKNVNYHGGAALPNKITPDTRGWGAPLKPEQIQAVQQPEPEPEEEAQPSRPPPPPVPYRANTTGLKTDHLPPPPIHRAIVDQGSPDAGPSQTAKPKPSLPPRLPPRQPSFPVAREPSPPPAYERLQSPSPVSLPPPVTPPVTTASNSGGYLNSGAINRLGQAGVSVPGLGIGEQPNPWKAERSQSTTSTNTNGGQLSELQARFARMNASSSSQQDAQSPSAPSPPTQGTTWAQKQQTLQTAQNFHKDPSSVSMQDARQAASTANNFRERHGDQIKVASVKANDFNKKYNLTGRMNNFLEKQASPTSEQPQSPPQVPTERPVPSPEVQALAGRKPPPPPPPKKPINMSSHPALANSSSGSSMPPPVPLGTKPR